MKSSLKRSFLKYYDWLEPPLLFNIRLTHSLTWTGKKEGKYDKMLSQANTPIYNTIDISKTILFIGAGVSMDQPSCLPSGYELTHYILRQCIGDIRAENLKNICDNCYNILDATSQIKGAIRLESIINYISVFEEEIMGEQFLLNGFKSFESIPSNQNHYLISKIREFGSIVLTSNYDLCIERMYDSPYTFEVKNGVSVVCQQGINPVYHFHGIPENVTDLGATIKRIKSGLPINFSDYLKSKFENGYNIIYIGYSGSDFFDIDIFFDHIADEKYDGIGIFYQYGNTIDDFQKTKAQKLISNFTKSEILFGNPTDYLKTLYEAYTNQIVPADIKLLTTIDQKWYVKFEEIFDDIEDISMYRDFATIYLCHFFGVNISKIDPDWPKTLEMTSDYLLDSLKYTYFDEIQYGNLTTQNPITYIYDVFKLVEISDYSKLIENFNAIKILHNSYTGGVLNLSKMFTLDSLIQEISRHQGSQSFSTHQVFAINRICEEYITNAMSVAHDKINIEALTQLLNCCNEFLKYDYIQYQYISYYTSIQKKKNILMALLNINTKCIQFEKSMMRIASEVGSFTEIIKVYINYVIARYLEGTSDSSKYEIAKYMNTAENLAQEIGDSHHLSEFKSQIAKIITDS